MRRENITFYTVNIHDYILTLATSHVIPISRTILEGGVLLLDVTESDLPSLVHRVAKSLTTTLSAQQLVETLNDLFGKFDDAAKVSRCCLKETVHHSNVS